MSRFDDRFNTYAVPQQNREHGSDATLRRGNLLSSSFIARKQFSREHSAMGQEIDISVKVEQQSWLIPISACTLSGETTVPQASDELLVNSEVWVIHAPDDGTPPVEKHTDGYHYVVHTRIETNG